MTGPRRKVPTMFEDGESTGGSLVVDEGREGVTAFLGRLDWLQTIVSRADSEHRWVLKGRVSIAASCR